MIEAALPRDARREDRTAGGTGFDETHGKARRGLGAGDAATRRHQQHRAAEAGAGQFVLESAEIAAHQRLQISVGAGSRKPLVFAHLRRDVGRQRHSNVRQRPRDQLGCPALVLRICEAMQKADGNRLDLLLLERLERPGDTRLVERHEHVALCIDALGDRQTQAPRHQRRRQVDVDIVLFEAVLVTDLDDVPKAFGCQKRGLRTLALDQRVGGERGAVDDHPHVRRRGVRLAHHIAQGGEHALFGRPGRGQHLGGEALGPALERHIGERAADVDAEPHCG